MLVCIRVKVVVLGQKLLYLGKVVVRGCIRANLFYSVKVVVFVVLVFGKSGEFGQSLYSGKGGCIQAKWLYSCKSGCIWAKRLYWVKCFGSGCIRVKVVELGQRVCMAKVVVFGQSGLVRAKWLFSAKVVVFGQSGFIRAKWFYSGKRGCIRVKWLYSGKVVVFGQKWLYLGKRGCIRANLWLYSGKKLYSGCIWAKLLYSGGCIRAKVVLLYLGKRGCIRANCCFSGTWL